MLAQLRRLDRAGHHVVITTVRSADTTLPVLQQLGTTPEYVVCSNGAVTLRRQSGAKADYRRARVRLFDPGDTLRAIRSHLPGARFALEEEAGSYHYSAAFPVGTTGLDHHEIRVELDDLLTGPATRVVAIAPECAVEEFTAIVEAMGLRQVSYAMGWSSWLDIAADGVNKAEALEMSSPARCTRTGWRRCWRVCPAEPAPARQEPSFGGTCAGFRPKTCACPTAG